MGQRVGAPPGVVASALDQPALEGALHGHQSLGLVRSGAGGRRGPAAARPVSLLHAVLYALTVVHTTVVHAVIVVAVGAVAVAVATAVAGRVCVAPGAFTGCGRVAEHTCQVVAAAQLVPRPVQRVVGEHGVVRLHSHAPRATRPQVNTGVSLTTKLATTQRARGDTTHQQGSACVG